MPEEEDPGGTGSTASERLGGAGGRGHARQPCREAAAVSNMVAMATWPRGTGSGRNSSRRGPRRPAPPLRARCHGDRPERGCAGGRGLLRPGPRMRPGPAPRGRRGGTRLSPGAARIPNLPDRPLGWKKKKQNCWLFAFGKQPRLCSWRVRWFPGAEGRESRGRDSSASGPKCFLSARRWAASGTPRGRGRPALPSRRPGLRRSNQAPGSPWLPAALSLISPGVWGGLRPRPRLPHPPPARLCFLVPFSPYSISQILTSTEGKMKSCQTPASLSTSCSPENYETVHLLSLKKKS